MSTFEFINILILAFGIYLLYACVQLKVSGVPTKGVMISSKINYKNAKDMKGFTDYVYYRCLAIGIAVVALSLVTIFGDLFQWGAAITLGCMVVLLAVCIYYSKMITYAQQTFILGQDVEALKARQKKMKEEKKATKKKKK